MVCLGLEPGAAEWKAQTNPLSYGGTQFFEQFYSSFGSWSFVKKKVAGNGPFKSQVPQ